MLLRLCAAAVMLSLGVLLAAAMGVLPERTRKQLLRGWFRGLLASFGARLVVHDADRLRGGLVVSNHVSWLDIVALQAACPMRLLAKTEVRSWPVLGPLAGRAGTLYIDRQRLSRLPEAVGTIADSLRAGDVVGAFPEGTTWCGLASGRYRPAVFQAAVDADVQVQPVAMRFIASDGNRTTGTAFVGEATLISAILGVARLRGLVVELSVLPELDPRQADRRELARQAERVVADVTAPMAPELPHLDGVAEPVAA